MYTKLQEILVLIIVMFLMLLAFFLSGCKTVQQLSEEKSVETCLPPGVDIFSNLIEVKSIIPIQSKDGEGFLIQYSSNDGDQEIVMINGIIMGIDLFPADPLKSVWIRQGLTCEWKEEFVGERI